nr:MAG TPA: hypothetical protein [Caudoviricetes sp.]
MFIVNIKLLRTKLQLYFYSFNLITSYFQSFSYFCRRSIYCYKNTFYGGK